MCDTGLQADPLTLEASIRLYAVFMTPLPFSLPFSLHAYPLTGALRTLLCFLPSLYFLDSSRQCSMITDTSLLRACPLTSAVRTALSSILLSYLLV